MWLRSGSQTDRIFALGFWAKLVEEARFKVMSQHPRLGLAGQERSSSISVPKPKTDFQKITRTVRPFENQARNIQLELGTFGKIKKNNNKKRASKYWVLNT